MNAIILAGGKATRMNGKDKAFLSINQEPLIKRQLRLLKNIFKRIIIVSNNPKEYRNLKGVEVVTDVVEHLGPLGGIFSGLLASKDKHSFVIACDMPFINTELTRYMFKKSSGYDAVVPWVNNRYEPLFCIYSKNCIKFIRKLFDKKIFKLSELLAQVSIKRITQKEILRFDSPEKIFMNINTPQDLERFNRQYVTR
jgi:molybdenum cofactor guanylyltransferase